MKALLLCLALLGAARICCSQNTCSASGNIVSEDGHPVPGAFIHLLNTNQSTVADKQGAFTLRGIHPGAKTLEISTAGYATLTTETFIVKDTSGIILRLVRASERLDEVVVSALKDEELLHRLPASLTALGAKEVEAYRLWNVQELSGIAPNLYAADPGDKRNVTSIRGVVSTSYEPAVATYVDGASQFGLDTYIPQLFDVERIEVLRGPQGTLYGRNAMGGVVNIITKQPSNTASGFAALSLGNYGQKRAVAALRLPLVKGKLFIGAAGLHEGMNGFYTNAFDDSRFDRQSTVAGNYYLKYLASASWSMLLNVKNVHNRNEGPFTLTYADQAFNPPFVVNQNATTRLVDDVWNASLSVRHAGRRFNFSSQTSYESNYRYYTSPIDADFSPLDAISISNDYGRKWNHVRVATQEFRLSSQSAGRLRWSAGAYAFYQDAPVKQATRFGKDAAMLGSPDSNFSLINTTNASDAGAAAYAEAGFRLGEKTELNAGLRYDYEHRKMEVLGEYQKDPVPTPLYAFRSDTSAAISFAALSPKLSISWLPAANHTLYLSYARGFRAGGLTPLSTDPSQPPLYPFQPEHSDNVEAGVRSRFWNNRLSLNAAIFYIRVSEVQVPTLVLPEAVTITRNTGSLSSRGAELEADALPLKGLELHYSFGYTHARYESLRLAQNGAEADLHGKRQIFTPDITSMLAMQYRYPLGKKQAVSLVFRGEWKYLGQQYFDLANAISQPPYSLFNVRFGAAFRHLELMLWGRNLADKSYISYAYDFGAVHLGAPRTYGLSVIGRF